MKEAFRDKTRDNLAYALNLLGVRAELAERGRAEERIHSSWRRSLGVIDILEGPIRWINVTKRDGSQHSPPQWWLVLCIPDDRLTPNLDGVSLRTARKKSFPLFGKVTSVTWTGDEYGAGLIATLTDDQLIKQLAARVGDLEVRSYSKEFSGWTLQVNKRFIPTPQDWRTITTIAEHLLSAPRGILAAPDPIRGAPLDDASAL